MNPEHLLTHFDRITNAPDAVPRLRRFILDLAVRGKLVKQDPQDEPASELLKALRMEKARGVKQLPPVEDGELQFKLPEKWECDRFGNLLELQYGRYLPATNRQDRGPVTVYGSNGVVGFHTDALTNEPAIIVGRKGSAGALNISNAPSWTTDVAYFLIPPNYFDLRFLFNLLITLNLDSLSRGVKPGLSRTEVYQLPVIIPPLAEQHRIVAKVAELMALCDRLEASQAEQERRRARLAAASLHRLNNGADASEFREHTSFHLNHFARITTRSEHISALRQTILNLAVRGKLVPQDPNDEHASDLRKRIQAEKAGLVKEGIIPRQKLPSSDLSGLAFEPPTKWVAVSFGDVCNFVTSGSRGWAEFYSDTGPKFIRAQNIRFGTLRLDDIACVNLPEKTEGTRTQVFQGDLLIVITGAGVTNPALLNQELGEAYVSQHVALIRPTTTNLSKWLLLCLMAPVGGRAVLIERAYGAGKPGLNLDNIRSLKIPLPPLAEQHRIVAKVEELMALCDQLEAHLTTAKTEGRRFLEAVLNQVLGTTPRQASEQKPGAIKRSTDRQDNLNVTHLQEQVLPKHSLKFTSSNPVKTVAQMVECLTALGGAATAERLLNVTGLGDDVEKFFDLLRVGRDSRLLSVPTGRNQIVLKDDHAD